MATSKREYIFFAFFLSLACITLIAVAVATDSWVESDAEVVDSLNFGVSRVNYGLFMGEQLIWQVGTGVSSPLHMTCVFEEGACAMSCKTTVEARREEVIALANGQTPSLTCAAATIIDESVPLREPSVISSTFYICLLVTIFLHLLCGLVAAVLAILNATSNPTSTVFGLPGAQWSNAISAIFGLAVLVMWGVYWTVSGLNEHLALAYVVTGELLLTSPALGYSYWLIIASTLCAIINVTLIEFRRWHLEKQPPAIKFEIDNAQQNGNNVSHGMSY